MQCPRCQQDNPSHTLFCLACGAPVSETPSQTRRYAELQDEIESLGRSLNVALEQQTAINDILRAISGSQLDVQPVFEAIAENAARLVRAWSVTVLRWDGRFIHLVAERGGPPGSAQLLRDESPWPPNTTSGPGRCIATGTVIHVPDVDLDPEADTATRELARRRGWRSDLNVPMLREGSPIGAISVTRVEAGPFSPAEIGLLKTFAAQAVIAIENVRLFKEARDALEQQTATSEILRAISRSPGEIEPVFDQIARNSALLCQADRSSVNILEGDWIRFVGRYNGADGWARIHVSDAPNGVRAIRDGMIFHVADVEADARMTPEALRGMRAIETRAFLTVPMQRGSTFIGSITVYRNTPGPFSERQVNLLKTFADQAVIAIENVRLFNELEERNRDLTVSLDRQTATADVLRIIAQSPSQLQPVLDAIAASAVRLLRARSGTLSRIVGDQIELAAHTSTDDAGDAATRAAFPQPLSSGGGHAQAIRNRAPLNIADAHTDPRLPEASHTYAQIRGFRSQAAVPMLRHHEVVGAIAVARREAGGFTDDEIALLHTFADQAVIAIENVRLFKELEARNADLTEALEQQTATAEILRAISRSPTHLQPVLDAIARNAALVCDAVDAMVQLREGEAIRIVAHFGPIARSVPHTRVLARAYATGRAILDREPFQIRDIEAPEADEFDQYRDAARQAGYRTLIAVPMLREGVAIGALTIRRRDPQPFTDKQTALLQTFADQAVIAIENVRLFNELGAANRDLQVASQHKSEFLANMSHELRTPLNAIIGFSEVLAERMFGEVNEKQDEYLKDIHASGQHLLSLINDILDLSKIEAGRMELELVDFHLPQAIENALALLRERALRRGIILERSIDSRLGEIQGDERKVKQVLLNLLSNAIKFTPEGGRIDVRAALNEAVVEVSVADTGVGIAPADLEAVFEEFRQVGAAEKKAEGTGLGLALARKFIELHGGRIWVKSQVGAGSTFTFMIPVRHGE